MRVPGGDVDEALGSLGGRGHEDPVPGGAGEEAGDHPLGDAGGAEPFHFVAFGPEVLEVGALILAGAGRHQAADFELHLGHHSAVVDQDPAAMHRFQRVDGQGHGFITAPHNPDIV